MIYLIKKHIILILLITSKICGISHDTTTIINYHEKKNIVIASEPDYPPYCFVDENGNADGFAVDLFKAATEAVGISIEIKIGVWSKIKEDLAEGKIDALPLVGRTPEREPYYDFTLPYLSLHGAIFINENNTDIESLNDLKKKSILVMKGDNAEEFVRREKISDKIFTTNTLEEAFLLLENGEYDAIITQRITGLKLVENLGLKSVEPLDLLIPKFRQDFCFAVKKGDQVLLNQLNEGLSIIIANNTYEDIRLKWFGPIVKEEVALEDILLIALYVFIPLLIIMSVVSIIVLKNQVKKRTQNLINEISEHKNTLEQLQNKQELLSDSEAQIRLLLNSTAEGIYGIDKNGNCTFCNRAALEILGFKETSEVIGKNMHNLIHYKRIDGTTCTIEECKIYRALSTGEGTHIADEILWRADGSYFNAEYFSYPIKQNFEVIGSVVTFWDITDRKKMTDELSETKEFLENLINYANTPIIVWNKSLIIERFNRAFERLTGRLESEVVGQKIDVLFHEKSIEGYSKLIESAIMGERWETVEIEILHKNGTLKDVLWNSANIYDKDSNLIATIAQGNDITERKVAENELLKMKEYLENEVEQRTIQLQEKITKLDKSQLAMLFMVEDLNEVTRELKEERRKLELSNKELEAFSYSVSHDLRAPLRAIDGFSKFIFEDYSDKLDDEGKRLLRIIRESANKMDRLIADMLNLSRLSRMEINFTTINMEAMALSQYHEVATEEEKATFELVIDKLYSTSGDSTLMKNVWQNLIGNAIKYSLKSDIKRIEIGSEEEDSRIIYWVKDYGAGFNEKYSSKLFGVFQRLHSDTEFEGTGVGLAIVKRVIHRHNGEVWAKGEINKGSTFYFSIPKRYSSFDMNNKVS